MSSCGFIAETTDNKSALFNSNKFNTLQKGKKKMTTHTLSFTRHSMTVTLKLPSQSNLLVLNKRTAWLVPISLGFATTGQLDDN